MGLFSLFKKPKMIEDNFFGLLTHFENKNKPLDNYFEGRGWFSPIEDEIDYIIYADLNGPSIGQKEFYKKVEINYKTLISPARPLIEQELKKFKNNFKIQNFEREFKIVSLSIPRLNNYETFKWEMDLEIIYDQNHLISVYFKGFEVENILLDG